MHFLSAILLALVAIFLGVHAEVANQAGGCGGVGKNRYQAHAQFPLTDEKPTPTYPDARLTQASPAIAPPNCRFTATGIPVIDMKLFVDNPTNCTSMEHFP